MSVLAGTSGWQYRDRRGLFWPPDVPQRHNDLGGAAPRDAGAVARHRRAVSRTGA